MLHIDLLQHKIIHLSKMAFKVGYIILQNKTAVCRNGSLEDEIVHKFGLNPLDSYTKKIQNQMRKKKKLILVVPDTSQFFKLIPQDYCKSNLVRNIIFPYSL